MQLILACFLRTEDVTVVVAGYILMPLLWSEVSLKRKAEELLELDESEDWRDVSRVTEDFFAVFCVAVRLHSVKRISPAGLEVVWLSKETLESFFTKAESEFLEGNHRKTRWRTRWLSRRNLFTWVLRQPHSAAAEVRSPLPPDVFLRSTVEHEDKET